MVKTNAILFIKVTSHNSAALMAGVERVRELLTEQECQWSGPYAMKRKRFSGRKRRQFALRHVPDMAALGEALTLISLPSEVELSYRAPLSVW